MIGSEPSSILPPGGEASARGTDGCGAGKILRGLHDVLLGAGDRRISTSRPARSASIAGSAAAARFTPTRPEVCRDFECEWLTRRDLPRQLRPDLVGTILMEDADSDEYRAVCAPEKPMAWRHPLVFAHLVAVAKSGRTVVAKAGLPSWRIFASGEWGPTV